MKSGTWTSCALAAVLPFVACSKGDSENEPAVAASGGTSGASGASASGGKTPMGGVSASSGNGGKAPAAGGRQASGGVSGSAGASDAGRGGTTGGVAAGGAASGGINDGGVAGDPGSSSGGMSSSGAAGTSASAGAAGDSSSDDSVERTWNFDSDSEGWIGAFSDYRAGEEEFYELEFAHAALPAELGDGGGLRLGGDNHSDDLFMYLSYRLEGLNPSSSYTLDVAVEIGTNAPSDCGGIGGAPGPSVHVKIGASPREPQSSVDGQGILRLNLDKGNQSTDGADLKRVGDIGNTLVCPDPAYQRKAFELSDFAATTASDGSLWLVVGTDSGFEGQTTVYYDRISVRLVPR